MRGKKNKKAVNLGFLKSVISFPLYGARQYFNYQKDTHTDFSSKVKLNKNKKRCGLGFLSS